MFVKATCQAHSFFFSVFDAFFRGYSMKKDEKNEDSPKRFSQEFFPSRRGRLHEMRDKKNKKTETRTDKHRPDGENYFD